MANVKRRLNAHKSAPKKEIKKRTSSRLKSLRSLRAVIDVKSSDQGVESNESKPDIVKKRVANKDQLYLSPREKVKILLQNGHQLKDKFDFKNKTLLKSEKTRQSKNTSGPNKSIVHDAPDPMKTTKGLHKSKYKYIMDDILKTEFGMTPGNNKSSAESSKNGVNNNNDSEITNQNDKTNHVNKKSSHQNHKTTNQKNKLNNKNDKPFTQNKRKKIRAVTVEFVSQATENIASESIELPNKQKNSKQASETPSQPLSSPRGKSKSKKTKPAEVNQPNTKEYTLGNGVVLTLSIYECDHCQKTFNRKYSLVRHMYVHLGRQPHPCPVCPKKFRILKNMKHHVEQDHCVQAIDENTETYACDICDKPFLTKENLKLHLTSHLKGENSFKCIYCDKKFSYQLLLIQHEKKHLVTGKYQCTICDVKYNSRTKLYVHVKSHLKLTDYICQYCGREFLRSNSMKRHIQTMHRGRTVQCPVCNKKLKGHLTEHMRTHDKLRPHKCPDCGKRFAQSTQMKVHRRGHTGFRPYICRICERPFSHSNALMLHLRRHTGEKPFPCAECPLSFSQLPHMKAHMYKIHGKENPYKCFKCNDYFKLKKDLVFHKKTCNGTGIDIDLYGEKRYEEIAQDEDVEIVPVESTMTLSRMRFLLALLLTMVASKEKLKYLGFNKRLVDDLLVESLEAMDQAPCRDQSLSPLVRLRTNIETLLSSTVPKEQMDKFKRENKSTEELLELLTSERDNFENYRPATSYVNVTVLRRKRRWRGEVLQTSAGSGWCSGEG